MSERLNSFSDSVGFLRVADETESCGHSAALPPSPPHPREKMQEQTSPYECIKANGDMPCHLWLHKALLGHIKEAEATLKMKKKDHLHHQQSDVQGDFLLGLNIPC